MCDGIAVLHALTRFSCAAILGLNMTCFTQPATDLNGHSTCSAAGVYQPAPTGTFMAFSGFSYVWEFFDLPTHPTLSSLLQLQHEAKPLCALNLTALEASHSTTKRDFLSTWCPAASTRIALTDSLVLYSQVLLHQRLR